MKAKEVLKILKITRPTLCKYVKEGKIKTFKNVNGQYTYDKNSVLTFVNQNIEPVNVIYCRVSTNKQKNDLENQKDLILNYCNNNGYKIDKIFKDIGSGMNFDRKDFQELLNLVTNYKIDKVFISYKDRLSRISFDMFNNLFKQFGCEIVIINNIDDEKTVEKEIFSEIITIIHSFSMKMYSKRRKDKLKLLKNELELEDAINP
jgi:putative resolvase